MFAVSDIRRWLFWVLVSLLLILGDIFGIITLAKDLVKSPLLSFEALILGQYQNFQTAFADLKKDDWQQERLKEKIRQLAVEQNQLSSCLEENEKLRKLLGLPLPSDWQYIDARPLGIVGSSMKIGRGSKDGLEKGMMVIADGILVGRLTKLERHTSSVALIKDAGNKIPVVVKKPKSFGIQGRGILFAEQNKLLLDRVLQTEDIQKGDLVVTSGDEGWLPELVIGQIEEVFEQKAEVYKRAIVTPLVDYGNLRIVFIVKPN